MQAGLATVKEDGGKRQRRQRVAGGHGQVMDVVVFARYEASQHCVMG
jgi:hypothetical protein